MRCLSLADAAREAGVGSVFYTNVEAPPLLPALAEATHGWKDAAGADLLSDLGPEDIAVLDGYHFSEQEIAAFSGAPLLMMEDWPHRPLPARWVLDSAPGKTAEDYGPYAPTAELLLGPAYALLRKDFAHARGAALTRREESDEIGHVLISLGATDPLALSPAAARAALTALPDARVTLVLSQSAPAYQEAARLSQDQPRLTLLAQTSQMARLISEADIAIGAPGSSAWERCCLGLPSVLLIVAENQKSIAESLLRAKAALLAEPSNIAAQIQLLKDPEMRKAMARNAASMVDGLGALRTLSALGLDAGLEKRLT